MLGNQLSAVGGVHPGQGYLGHVVPCFVVVLCKPSRIDSEFGLACSGSVLLGFARFCLVLLAFALLDFALLCLYLRSFARVVCISFFGVCCGVLCVYFVTWYFMCFVLLFVFCMHY